MRFDWSLLRGWTPPAPWILAGGLTVDNVAEAIRITGARAVDVSSGVEQSPGVKDPALIRAFIASARAD
jgi:phosphoribosylanthranilate isomerase